MRCWWCNVNLADKLSVILTQAAEMHDIIPENNYLLQYYKNYIQKSTLKVTWCIFSNLNHNFKKFRY